MQQTDANPDLALFHADGHVKAEWVETFADEPVGTTLSGILYFIDDADNPTRATKMRGILSVDVDGIRVFPESALQ